MQANSRSVTSNQEDIHEHLETVVQKHLQHPFTKPLKESSARIFAEISQFLKDYKRKLIFDSGCGTGESTLAISRLHPEALVLGIDKSALRISKAKERIADSPNILFVRAELIDIWRLAAEANWQLQHHYILYPNPWPKKRHLRRRWHAHPVFPSLLELGGELHLRSNWRTYLDEFAFSVELATKQPSSVQLLTISSPISAFEAKYAASGQQLFECRISLKSPA